jgi:type II secretory pathway pseudopilin PulG
MIVVVIVGILASLAIYGTRKYILSSKTAESTQMIGAIKAAQEVYLGDTMSYLDVSGSHSISDTSTFYPATVPAKKKWAWGGGTGAVADAWRALNVQTDGSGVMFIYGCAAGDRNDPVAAPATSIFGKSHVPTLTNWPATHSGPWYVVKAAADLDGDGKAASVYVAASFTDQIFNNTDLE